MAAGTRGMRPGGSIARLLAKHRGVRYAFNTPKLTTRTILAWADEHRRRTGRWPKPKSGKVLDDPYEKWSAIQAALFAGTRGLPGRDTLPRFLARHRGVRNQKASQRLTVAKILSWADAHYRRFREWPKQLSGPVYGQRGETWAGISVALVQGTRGLPGGQALGRLLYEHRGVRNVFSVPDLSIEQILDWADEHHKRTGNWPTDRSGKIRAAPAESWSAINAALYHGSRGMPSGGSLARLLHEKRGYVHHLALPRLTFAKVLRWADAHKKRTGEWPHQMSGPVVDAPGENWKYIDSQLRLAGRGLPRRTSLSRLLERYRGKQHRLHRPRLRIADILRWATAYFDRTGTWPNDRSGPIPEAPGETWTAIEKALYRGTRGMTGGWTIPRLLKDTVAKQLGGMKSARRLKHQG
jgi:hypothetical protein